MDTSTSPLPVYAWPGGYPIIYCDPVDGATLCHECAWHAACWDTPLLHEVYWEGPTQYCDDCGREIESAYGDPDEDAS